MMRSTRENIKISHMRQLADYREGLRKAPQLRQLFLELTLQCNEHCLHCGSSCGSAPCPLITLEQYKTFLTKIKHDFDISRMMLCITGGEPLLRPDFFEIMGFAHDLGFQWGMTSNATLITPEIAHKLRETGMRTISVSVDGLRETHDAFRGRTGAYDAAMAGIDALVKEGGFHNVQITSVFTHESIGEMEKMYEVFRRTGIDSWRLVGMEPIGRALEHQDLRLTPEDWRHLFDFIREKRAEGLPLAYGCTHYLGLEYEREVRPWYWLCNAGVYVASVMTNGDIGACLDIERRPETIQGNILKDDFTEVWKNRFGIFRQDLSEQNEDCRSCTSRAFCQGGAFHSWDYDGMRPRVCFRGILFEDEQI